MGYFPGLINQGKFIAIKKPDGNLLFKPSFEAAIMLDGTAIAVGELENLQKLEKILNP